MESVEAGKWKKVFFSMWAAQCVGMSAITGVVSFLPLYVANLGVTNENSLGLWAGILMGATSFFAALTNPYWGNLADRKGRKPMVEKTLVLFGLVMLAMAFVSNVYQLLALRIFQGICGGFVAAATALGISMMPKGKIAFAVGMFQTALIVGGAIGPMIGGLVADHFGYRMPFAVFGVLTLVTFAFVHYMVVEKFEPQKAKQKSSLKEIFHYILHNHELRLMLLILFLAQFAMQTIAPILPIYIQGLAKDTSSVASISGTIIAIGGLASALAASSMGFFCRKFSHRQILGTAALLCAITFIGQLAAGNVITLGLMRAINGFCIGMMIPSANTIITCLIPEDKRGAAYGITGSASLMGNVLGPLSAGLLSILFGLSSIFWITAALFVGAFILLIEVKGQYTSQIN